MDSRERFGVAGGSFLIEAVMHVRD